MRLIDADALNVRDIFCSYDTVTDLIDVEVWIDHAPTIDAVPVVHGKWRWTERGDCDYEQYWVCSSCGQQQYIETNFCPDCGADMREVKK